jgi:uncharacterized low-complexity protein
MMNNKTKLTVLGAAIATSVAGSVAASENPFEMKDLAVGYMQVAEAGKETKEMVCGEGKCGSQKAMTPEMNCGAMMNQSKPTESQQNKAMEGKCAGMTTNQPSSAPATAPAPSK